MNPHPDSFKMDRSATEHQFAMEMICLTDWAHPKKLHRSLGTGLPYIPR